MTVTRSTTISALGAWLLLVSAASAFEAAGPAVVSDIDWHLPVDVMGTITREYQHQDGPNADHPWIAIDVQRGEKLDIGLYTTFPSTFWLYRVMDGHAEPGNSPFAEVAQILLLKEADYPNSKWPRIWEFPVDEGGQLLVQVDATAGVGGRYGLQIERTLPTIPEPTGTILVGVATTFTAAFHRLLMGRRRAAGSR